MGHVGVVAHQICIQEITCNNNNVGVLCEKNALACDKFHRQHAS